MYNKYSHISDLTLLKAKKPRKRITPSGPDIANFNSFDTKLKKLATFGMEMMKFMPEWEVMMYEGTMLGEDRVLDWDLGTSRDVEVTDEWYDAFNKYSITQDDINADDGGAGGGGIISSGNAAYLQVGDTNMDVIRDCIADGHNPMDWGNIWAFGKHHAVGSWMRATADENIRAGSGAGQAYNNVDFRAKSNEWSHIKRPKSESWDASIQGTVENQAHFVNSYLSGVGKSWSDVKAMLNRTGLANKSFYEIVMSGAYKSLTNPEDAFLLIAAMTESRERAWDTMTEVFGPVTDTQNDRAMINHLDQFIRESNPYMNHHNLGLFKFFLEIQHSVINQMTMFYEKNEGNGFNKSVIDQARFWEFAKWIGRLTYDNYGSQNGSNTYGKLYEYRDGLSSDSAKNTVEGLIHEWFGAAGAGRRASHDSTDKIQSTKPQWSGYGEEWNDNRPDDASKTWGGAAWVSDPDGNSNKQYFRKGYKLVGGSAYFESYAWDRKMSEFNLEYRLKNDDGDWDNGGHTVSFWNDSANWTRLVNRIYGKTDMINEMGTGHKAYTIMQVNYLDQYARRGMGEDGHYFYNNWVVHAVGQFMKYGVDMDMVRVMEKNSQNRTYRAEFKRDKTDYKEREEELQYEEKIEARAAQKAIQRRRALRKQFEQKRNAAAKANGSNNNSNNNNRKKEYKIGSKQYEKAMQRLRQRLLKQNKKRQAWLNKITGQNNKKK